MAITPTVAAIEAALSLGDMKGVACAVARSTPAAPLRLRGLDARRRDARDPEPEPEFRSNSPRRSSIFCVVFVEAPGKPLSRTALLAALRGRAWNYFDRSIDTLVARLRKKIGGDRQKTPLIRSVRGVGYVFCANVSAH